MDITANTIHVCGDVHGYTKDLNDYIYYNRPDVLIITGDTAFLYNDLGFTYNDATVPVFSDKCLKEVKPLDTKILWLPGNHEGHDALNSRYNRYAKEPIEIAKNIWYCPWGSTVSINGKICLFVGGARSYDYETRYKGVDWFPEFEMVTDKDYDVITGLVDKAQIIFSHTCPSTFQIQDVWDPSDKITDTSRYVLENLRRHYDPEYWFFGHWHRQRGGTYENTIWQCLNGLGVKSPGKWVIDISNIFSDNSGI